MSLEASVWRAEAQELREGALKAGAPSFAAVMKQCPFFKKFFSF